MLELYIGSCRRWMADRAPFITFIVDGLIELGVSFSVSLPGDEFGA
jgi:hypothetical protein